MIKIIEINTEDDMNELAAEIRTAMIADLIMKTLPATCYLLAALSPANSKGNKSLNCAACKLVHSINSPETAEFIFPDNMDDSLEAAIIRYVKKGKEAPKYIKNLYEVNDPIAQEKAISELGKGNEKSDDWIIFNGIKSLRKLKCLDPEHEMEILKNISIPTPEIKM